MTMICCIRPSSSTRGLARGTGDRAAALHLRVPRRLVMGDRAVARQPSAGARRATYPTIGLGSRSGDPSRGSHLPPHAVVDAGSFATRPHVPDAAHGDLASRDTDLAGSSGELPSGCFQCLDIAGTFSPNPLRRMGYVPTMYGAWPAASAVSETVFHDLDPHAATQLVARSQLLGLVRSVLVPARDIKLISLRGSGLRRLRTTHADLIESDPSTYPATAALHTRALPVREMRRICLELKASQRIAGAHPLRDSRALQLICDTTSSKSSRCGRAWVSRRSRQRQQTRTSR